MVIIYVNVLDIEKKEDLRGKKFMTLSPWLQSFLLKSLWE